MYVQIFTTALFSMSIFSNVILARTTTLPNDDVTNSVSQSDGGLAKLDDAIQTLEDVRYTTNTTFQTLCTKFCEANSPSITCCHDIKMAALSLSHLSSRSRDISGSATIQNQLSSVLTSTTTYQTEIHQIVLTTQKRACHLYWDSGRECPLSRDMCQSETPMDAKYCHLKQLTTDISSFKLILQQMISANGVTLPTEGSPTVRHEAINDVTIQNLRDLYVLASACNTWSEILAILRNISTS